MLHALKRVTQIKALFARDTTLDDLVNVINGLSEASAARGGRVDAQEGLRKAMLALIHREAPSIEQSMSYALSSYDVLIDNELHLVEAEKRTKDDLQDIIERNHVVTRFEKEYDTAIADLDAAKQSLADTQRGSNTVAIVRATALKEERVERAREATKELIRVRRSYLAFKANRLTHALSTYSSALTTYGSLQADVYDNILSACTSVRTQNESGYVAAETLSNPFD